MKDDRNEAVLARGSEEGPRPSDDESSAKLPTPATPARLGEVVIGTLMSVDAERGIEVDFAENPARRPIPARSTQVLEPHDVGRDIALLFESGDPARPLVVGLVRRAVSVAEETPSEPAVARVDGQKVILSAETEIELRCGEASITLTRAGKIVLRGKFILSRSTGVNRIKGGAVQIN